MDQEASTGPGRRERKKADQRRALQQAALELVSAQGYEHTTVEAIAESCDVSTRTFFNYFSSKDDALLGPVLERHQLYLDAFDARPTDENPIEALRAASIQAAENFTRRSSEWHAHKALLQANPVLMAHLHGSFADLERKLAEALGKRLGVDAKNDPYPSLVVGVAVTVLRVSALHGRTTGTQIDTPKTAERLFDIVLGGLLSNQPAHTTKKNSRTESKTENRRTSPRV